MIDKESKLNFTVFLITIILFFLPQLSYASLSWTTKTPMPTKRYDMAEGMVDGIIYVIGGDPGSLVPISTVEAYDTGSDSWEAKSNMPYNMHRLAAAAVNDKIYTCGGWYGMGAKPYTFEYDPGSDSWTQKADMPAARIYHAAASCDGYMYAFGGRYTYNTVYEYDPVGDSWSTKTPMPTGRYGHAAVTLNGKIYCLGGQDGSTVFSTVEEYDPVADSWTTKAPLPTPRAYLTACVLRDTIFAIGGSDNTKAYLSTVEKYDPVSDNWVSETAMPTPRRAPVSDVVDNIIYVIGGDNGEELGTNEATEPATSIEVSSFYASAIRGKIQLHWRIEAQCGIVQWIIKRGTGSSYSIIAEIPASGSTPTMEGYTYTDENIELNQKYFYRIGAQFYDSNIKWYGPVSAIVQTNKLPQRNLIISPNPFRETTVISFHTIDTDLISLNIYDLCGRLVKSIRCNRLSSTVKWNGRDNNGKDVAPGIYFIKMKTDEYSQSSKVILIK